MCGFRVDIQVPYVSLVVFDQVYLLEVWKCPASSYASMQWYEVHKATATSSCFHSKSTLSEDFQSTNREQFVVSIVTEKSQKLHCHKQAYFVLQLCISMPFPSTQDLQKPGGSISSHSERDSNIAIQKQRIYKTST